MPANLIRRLFEKNGPFAGKAGGARPTIAADEAINALYIGILGRRADPEGLNQFLRRLEGGATLAEIASEIARSPEQQERAAVGDHSQDGEFKLLLARMVARAAPHAIVVDVGAHGRERSNAYDLMAMYGWQGLLVEANPELWDGIERDFAGLKFQLARCGVSTTGGTSILHIGVDDDVSSLLAGAAAAWGPIRDQVQIETRRLGDILDDYRIPKDFDVLSVDVEGLDVPVVLDLLGSTDYAPRWIILESPHQGIPPLEEIGLSSLAGRYRVVAQTIPNVILEAIAHAPG